MIATFDRRAGGIAALVVFLCLSPIVAQVRYEVVFVATWSEQTHPTEFPPNPHFSPLVGGLHNDSVTFWEVGGLASDGMETMAETGATDVLVGEIQQSASQGDASNSTIVGEGFGSPESRSLQFDATLEFSRITLVSMLAPSPDWFVGVAGLPLAPNGRWRDDVTVALFAYDAGSDSGTTYLSSNDDTVPAEPIVRITTPPLADAGGYQPPVGSYTFSIVSVDGLPPYVDTDGDGEGDHCDLDDGMIYIRFVQPRYVEWDAEQGFSSWNCYRGDLIELRQGGDYTQDRSAIDLAAVYCDLSPTNVLDLDPDPGAAAFYLVTGIAGTESGLGADSSGVERPNTAPCP